MNTTSEMDALGNIIQGRAIQALGYFSIFQGVTAAFDPAWMYNELQLLSRELGNSPLVLFATDIAAAVPPPPPPPPNVLPTVGAPFNATAGGDIYFSAGLDDAAGFGRTVWNKIRTNADGAGLAIAPAAGAWQWANAAIPPS